MLHIEKLAMKQNGNVNPVFLRAGSVFTALYANVIAPSSKNWANFYNNFGKLRLILIIILLLEPENL